ncbi:glycosyl hydrolase family 18 protein [Flavitalea sp. BT771]|uniref:glycosyl hydrolase family 18 protein n=1 Tax=Flavitalea sp. BT771 TaxID=3063329 RepID=UPI0026E38128|nr:glycosyl hydrolase family 18 protein [Flavitalea sp. BT771]MDO6430244.1 glycosyl hydrolase family 18 protein [Flavitalea sp. BT771]MDV6219616.1 glycosyl hydrolase family 18 protein [Flavitalea sp. BT771]
MITKRKTLITATLAGLLLIGACGKNDTKANNPTDPVKGNFRVVGYLPRGVDLSGQTGMPDLGKITHLNIAFMNPDSTGAFPADENISKLTALAHASGVSVLLSIGGGNPPAHLKTLLGGSHQAALVQALAALTEQYNCDGIDVDLEGDFIDGNYERFVKNLAVALRAKKKLMTAAIATAYANSYTDAALAQYDFVNIMSYDKTGPWTPSNPGPHAPYSMAVDDLAYWGGTRGIPKAKMTLGLPFYGYGFGANAPESMSYQDIVNKYPASWNVDQLTVPGGGIVYYNGYATIQDKTALALKNAGGVMIWQLLQDATGERSLLKAINTIIHH